MTTTETRTFDTVATVPVDWLDDQVDRCEAEPTGTESRQLALLWLGIGLLAVYALALVFLMRMLPPPPADWTDQRVAQWYREHGSQIRLGAAIAALTSASVAPLFLVMGVQIARQERGLPVLGILSIILGGLTSLLVVVEPIIWGMAAYDPDRSPELTALMHQLGTLTFISTDQYYIFPFLAVSIICFAGQRRGISPFPRWFGYFSLWATLMFEAGAVCFLTKTGPFAWNGLMTFWIPFNVFGLWFVIGNVLLIKSLKRQRAAALDAGALPEA